MTSQFPPSNEKAYSRHKITKIYFILARFVKINLEMCLLIKKFQTDTSKQKETKIKREKKTCKLQTRNLI